ncbi:Putative alpha,alpha-trehalose-phosphate synthase [UDP-forming] 100 kDa [Sparassis crispa]|uniref:Alpha,alpha-trehalose-phosphate synthase [UDP-forming] 100 kDa n=1 Tax=Sparassis crispa TaxID=139825 RepID=A0A401GXV4_9APHY|nr:Putative alpha,alpha-trehalose-phosphate synthase [UDP-forming] 100 kDa [Sparassis crispa]GBE87033.1 Putative alpha,alpha-trehalose-phosphate synthase [UDP-forming] 100 kDa [Sparassis crispa]
MSSLRQHRVIIASLFLPTTAVLGDSAPSSPLVSTPGDAPSFPSAPPPVRPFLNKATGPLKSIVEDLKDKSRQATPAATPRVESSNPFTSFPGLDVPENGTSANGVNGNHVRPHQITHPNSTASQPRVQRRLSRSSSHRTPTRSLSNHSHDLSQGWHLESNPHCNGGLKNAVGSMGVRMQRKLWVGTLGINTDRFRESLRRSMEWRMRDDSDSTPVWIPDAEFASCYDEFCHQVLWPCLHYAIPDAPKTKSFYESASYKQYVAVNQRFADTIAAAYTDGDIIWVNDYHLMLLPAMLRARLPGAPIGFFMHVAFPSSEIFRCLSMREELLRGLLGADLIGFQTANFARHFRQTVSRILAAEALPKGVQMEDRFVDVGVFPMGIDVSSLTEKKHDPEVAEWVKLLKQRYAGMKLIVGRDKLDEIQGVRHKMQAFEAFLDKYPDYQGKVVMIQVALQTTEENEAQGGVTDMVSHLNSRFSTLTYQPVVFLHTQDLTFTQYLALLTVADAFMVTSLREGMALRTHEYVECQEERHRPLILSEFTGSYSYSGFRSCIPINPWDKRMTANAIYQALTMSDDEATSRWEDMHNHVVTQSAQTFVTSFLLRCLRASIEHLRGDTVDVAELDVARILPRYRHSQKRLLLIDFEGTIWQRDMRSIISGAFDPPADAIRLLNRLAEDSRNEVWLLSGLQVKGVLEVAAKAAPQVGIVAENGCFIKMRPGRNGESSWINMVVNFNLTWKAPCLEILNYFTERTPGSFIEEREASIVWRFWTEPDHLSDRQWARRQAAEAQNHIFDSLGERYGLRIIPGANSFLVLPNNISRSTAVGAILQPGGPAHAAPAPRPSWMTSETSETAGAGDVDFVLAVGKDEKLMRRLNELDCAETVSTGRRGTDAKWKLDPDNAVPALWRFAETK